MTRKVVANEMPCRDSSSLTLRVAFIRHEGVIDAGTHREALPQLTQRKLFPLEVQDQDAAKNPFGYRARTTLKSQD